MRYAPEHVVLVTGAARGVGADIALQLARPGTHVVVNYREDGARADAVAQAIRRGGGQACTFAADVSDAADTAAMVDAIRSRLGRLDALILNASGDAQVNREAQKRLVTLAMPLMPAGARIVFTTTHQAHFFPDKAVPKGYAAVALGKRAAETALYAMRPAFDRAGIGFTVVSADLTDGTGAFASAIARAASGDAAPGVVYVGGADYMMTA